MRNREENELCFWQSTLMDKCVVKVIFSGFHHLISCCCLQLMLPGSIWRRISAQIQKNNYILAENVHRKLCTRLCVTSGVYEELSGVPLPPMTRWHLILCTSFVSVALLNSEMLMQNFMPSSIGKCYCSRADE